MSASLSTAPADGEALDVDVSPQPVRRKMSVAEVLFREAVCPATLPDLDDDDSVHDVEEASMPRPLPGPAEAAGGTGVFDSHADSGRHLSADGRSQRGVDAQSGVAGGLATLRSSWSILKQDFAILGGKG